MSALTIVQSLHNLIHGIMLPLLLQLETLTPGALPGVSAAGLCCGPIFSPAAATLMASVSSLRPGFQFDVAPTAPTSIFADAVDDGPAGDDDDADAVIDDSLPSAFPTAAAAVTATSTFTAFSTPTAALTATSTFTADVAGR